MAIASAAGADVPASATKADLERIVADVELDEPEPVEAVSAQLRTVDVGSRGYGALNVRSAPGMGAPVVGTLDDGAEVEVLGTSDDGKWCKLGADGKKWALAEFIRED